MEASFPVLAASRNKSKETNFVRFQISTEQFFHMKFLKFHSSIFFYEISFEYLHIILILVQYDVHYRNDTVNEKGSVIRLVIK